MATVGKDPQQRDLVVIGSSAGGVEALPRLLTQLPSHFPAAVGIVQHLMPTSSGLVDILQRASALPVRWGEHGDELTTGTIYVAPGGVHMLFDRDKVVLAGGARENHSRPAINRLFRSAAAHHGSRTIGVLLTGMLDDGVAGLIAIQKAGGSVIVQHPADAAFPSMPESALAALKPDRVVPIDALGASLILMTREKVRPVDPPADVLLEARLDADDVALVDSPVIDELGPQTAIACPECGGPLWPTGEPPARSYRCYLGHVTSSATLLSLKSVEVERALWSAVRALQERSATLSKLASDARRAGNGLVANDYETRARETSVQADRARHFLLELQREPLRQSSSSSS